LPPSRFTRGSGRSFYSVSQGRKVKYRKPKRTVLQRWEKTKWIEEPPLLVLQKRGNGIWGDAAGRGELAKEGKDTKDCLSSVGKPENRAQSRSFTLVQEEERERLSREENTVSRRGVKGVAGEKGAVKSSILLKGSV